MSETSNHVCDVFGVDPQDAPEKSLFQIAMDQQKQECDYWSEHFRKNIQREFDKEFPGCRVDIEPITAESLGWNNG